MLVVYEHNLLSTSFLGVFDRFEKCPYSTHCFEPDLQSYHQLSQNTQVTIYKYSLTTLGLHVSVRSSQFAIMKRKLEMSMAATGRETKRVK